VTRVGESNTWRTLSTLTLTPDSDTNVTCEASSSEVPAVKVSPALEIRLRFKPQVEIEVSRDVVKEGESFEVLCRSQAYPSDLAYRWFFSGEELEGITNNSILIEEISRMYDQSDITCLVENEEGMTKASTSLDIRYPPTILLHPKSKVARRKENVTFHCVAEGNPRPAYVWTRDREETLLQAAKQNLSVIASEKTEAVYRCHVFAEGYQMVASLPASLTLIRAPQLETECERKGVLGQDLILHCATRAVTNRTRILWMKSNPTDAVPQPEPIDLTRDRVSVITNFKDWRLTSDLIIRKLSEEDLGHYACFAENEVGTDVARINVIQQSGIDILAIVAAVTCVATTLLLAVFLYTKLKGKCSARDPDKC